MLTFIITNIFLISLATVLFMVARVLPRIEAPEEQVRQNALERLVTSGIPEKVDAFLAAFFAKFLRRAKVVIMKIDNLVTTRLQNFAKEGKVRVRPDFKEMAAGKREEDSKGETVQN